MKINHEEKNTMKALGLDAKELEIMHKKAITIIKGTKSLSEVIMRISLDENLPLRGKVYLAWLMSQSKTMADMFMEGLGGNNG